MKQKLLLKTMLLLFALIAGSSSVWAADVVGTINFGSATGSTKIQGSSSSGEGTVTYTDTGDDSQGNTWTITTVSSTGKSFTQNASYSQVGASSKPATSITFTTTLPQSQTIKAFSAKFGGFTSTAGDVTLKVGSTTVGSGSLNGTTDVVVSATNTTTSGTVLTVTVTNIAKGVKCYYISYTYESSLNQTTISFPEASYTNILGEAFTEPTLTCNSNGTVEYSSSNTAVAEVNSSTGKLTIKKAGNATITASVPETATYTAGSASYNLIVQGTIVDGVFDFAINRDYGSGATPGTDANNTTETTWTAGNVTLAVAGRNVWYNGADLRLYKTSGTKAAGNITLSVTGDRYITRIDLTGGTNLELTSGGGVKNGTTWSGKSQEVKFTHDGGGTITLTKITVTYCTETEFNTKVNITMGSDGYMTYCNQDAALSFGTLEAFVVSAVGDNNVTLTPITKAPAGCAVVLKGAAGSYDLTKEETPDEVATNRLRVSSGTITSNASYDVYALAKKNDIVGFYKVQAGVQVPAGKCYISVNKSSSAPEFFGLVGDGNTTGMNDVRSKMEEGRGEFYNLNGQRVAQPTKGLYIVNGKKVVIK